MSKLTRAAYERLIAENVSWLDSLPTSPERNHVRAIVLASADHEYADIIEQLQAEQSRCGRLAAALARVVTNGVDAAAIIALLREETFPTLADTVAKLTPSADGEGGSRGMKALRAPRRF